MTPLDKALGVLLLAAALGAFGWPYYAKTRRPR